MENKAFYKKLYPYAKYIYLITGMPVSVLLAQFAHESGFESPSWIGHNNYAGITNPGGATRFKQYATIIGFANDYVKTIRLKYYAGVLAAVKAKRTPDEIALELSKSPWDAGHYGGGQSLLAKMKADNLYQYDQGLGLTMEKSPEQQATDLQKAVFGESGIALFGNLNKSLDYLRTAEFWEKFGLIAGGTVLVIIGLRQLSGTA